MKSVMLVRTSLLAVCELVATSMAKMRQATSAGMSASRTIFLRREILSSENISNMVSRSQLFAGAWVGRGKARALWIDNRILYGRCEGGGRKIGWGERKALNAKGAKGAKVREGRVEVVIDEGVSPWWLEVFGVVWSRAMGTALCIV